ncbi:helix-turn-helix domain-containing protein [Chitinophaga skermanii]|nr:helix-turn-helix domain-containing protein [Chitinophaga skermanii]
METLEDFYRQKFNQDMPALARQSAHFNVFNMESCTGPGKRPVQYSRRDYYKISLLRGHNRYHYADKTMEVNGPTLIFFNPQVPYTFDHIGGDNTGYFCIFKDEFFTEKMRGGLSELPMFALGGKPSYVLNEAQEAQVAHIFEKMVHEVNSDYAYKSDLLRNYVMELIHNALKMEPSTTLVQNQDANLRITNVFKELLERQFPIENQQQQFSMRSPKDFANQLAVHVNHLNKAIKTVTGKTTTQHIAERLTSEAKALLKHTNWNVSEIGYTLGFEDPSHFNNFFKKQVAITPSAFRMA